MVKPGCAMAQAVANFIHKYSIHFNTLYHIPLELRCLYVCIYQKSLNIPMLGRYSSFSTFSSGMHNTKTHFFWTPKCAARKTPTHAVSRRRPCAVPMILLNLRRVDYGWRSCKENSGWRVEDI